MWHKNLNFLPQNHKNHSATGGSAPQAPSVIRLSYIDLFSTGPKLDNFWAKKFTYGLSFLPLSKNLVALLAAFAASKRFFKRFFEPHTKRAKKRCRPDASLFLDMNTNFLKHCIIWSSKISVFMWKSSIYFSAPHFRLVLPQVVCSGDGTGVDISKTQGLGCK